MAFLGVLWFPPAAGNPNCPYYWLLFNKTNSERLKVHTCAQDMAAHTAQLLTITQKLILHIAALLSLLNHCNLSVSVKNSKASNSKTSLAELLLKATLICSQFLSD